MKAFNNIVDSLVKNRNLSDAEFAYLIESSEFDEQLFSAADRIRRQIYGEDVYIRGLIEFTNYCKNNCYYCGIRNNNKGAVRYRGGESTVQGKLMHELNLFDKIKELIENDFPVFGTCAGLLLLAKNIENDNRLHLGTMDITAVRNAYGRQLGSFYTEEEFKGIGKIPMTFIRAPFIESVQNDTEILAEVNGHIVAAKQKNQLVTAFHPELNDDISVHKYFINIIEGAGTKCTDRYRASKSLNEAFLI